VFKLKASHFTLLRRLVATIVKQKSIDASKVTIRLVSAVVSYLPYTRYATWLTFLVACSTSSKKLFIIDSLNRRNMETLLGNLSPVRLEYESGVSNDRYAELLMSSSILLDSYPYGAMSTLIDALSSRLPAVVREGDRWHNRIAPAILRSLGFEVIFQQYP
jgi:hypothetical protein